MFEPITPQPEPIPEDELTARRRGAVGGHNKAKTHCPQGHEYTPENTYIDNKNRRYCVACRKAHSDASNARRRARRLEERGVAA